MTNIIQFNYFRNHILVGGSLKPGGVNIVYDYREKDSMERDLRELQIYASELENQLEAIYKAAEEIDG